VVTAVLDASGPSAAAPDPTTTTDARRLGFRPALEGLRGIAFVMVFVDHTRWFPKLQFGGVAIYLFFGLSGFLVTTQLVAEAGRYGKVDIPRFFTRRILRLAPALALMLGVWIVVVALFPHAGWTTTTPGGGSPGPTDLAVAARGAVGALGLLTNWLDILQLYGGRFALGHLWFVAVQEQLYLIWVPVLVVLLCRARRLVVPAALSLAALSLVESLVLMHGRANWLRIYAGTDTRATAILLGCAAAMWWSEGRLDWLGRSAVRVIASVLVVGSLAWALVGLSAPAGSSTRAVAWVLATLAGPLLVVVLVVARSGWLTRILSHRTLVYLGSRSYALYLWHYVWLTWWAGAGLLGIGAGLLASLVCAEAFWRLVEERALKLARHRRPEPAVP
jgi:peptidoglycan/LPS O-acetylase OafA/YrhL